MSKQQPENFQHEEIARYCGGDTHERVVPCDKDAQIEAGDLVFLNMDGPQWTRVVGPRGGSLPPGLPLAGVVVRGNQGRGMVTIDISDESVYEIETLFDCRENRGRDYGQTLPGDPLWLVPLEIVGGEPTDYAVRASNACRPYPPWAAYAGPPTGQPQSTVTIEKSRVTFRSALHPSRMRHPEEGKTVVVVETSGGVITGVRSPTPSQVTVVTIDYDEFNSPTRSEDTTDAKKIEEEAEAVATGRIPLAAAEAIQAADGKPGVAIGIGYGL